MTTAVQSPPSFQSLSRLGWNAGSTNAGGFSAMSSDDPNRMFVPQRKTVTRSTSSSSLASNSSTSSTSTVLQSEAPSSSQASGDGSNTGVKKKPRGGFWPVSKAESTSGVSNARANGAVQPASSNTNNSLASKGPLQPAVPSQQNHVNGTRSAVGPAGSMEQAAILALLPMNGTFERKQINVPYYPDILKIGRQTNAKTIPTPVNGYFDSKVLSRQHAEIWAERNGKIWIRDVKSSNGTFVNGHRLSPENKESEPHELRQHDTLELGIDIVSEDQKTIVHHKVSAKVEFAGLPGSSNNVLDLSFGDLDPSQGGSLLASPMSQPMVQSRSRPGGPPNGRMSAASSVVGSQMNSAAQQRQTNFWGTPLNIEQLVKHLSIELRTAKQQAQDLDQANNYLTSMMSPDGSPSKLQPPVGELSASRQSSGRVKASRVDHAARFGDPPAPPPQQPLPEKPDSSKSSPVNNLSISNLLKRSDTAKPPTNGTSQSPTGPQSSQILSLVSALEVAKKELDSQSTHIKQLEDMLNKERMAREAAEERARRVEETASARPVTNIEDDGSSIDRDTRLEANPDDKQEDLAASSEQALQQKLENMVAEMQRMKGDIEQANERADIAEQDATSARTSLADMIERIRKENESLAGTVQDSRVSNSIVQAISGDSTEKEEGDMSRDKHSAPLSNGHVRHPSRLPQALETVMATMIRENHKSGDITAQSAPYVSMLGVVLIGVGLMAYLNSWQKGDK